MALVEDTGLSTGKVAALEDLVGARPTEDRPNVIRLRSRVVPREAFEHSDVLVRPSWVHWIRAAGDGADGMLAAQSPGTRWRTRRSAARLSALALDVGPLEGARYQAWTALYTSQLDRLRTGVDYFSLARPGFDREDLRLATWSHDGVVECGCVYQFDTANDALVMRFGAARAAQRPLRPSPGMYLFLAGVAQRSGLRWVTLGSDVNFYGAIAGPGLCTFKWRLGFTPVPAELMGMGRSRTLVERVLSLAGLEAPVLVLAYRRCDDLGLPLEAYLSPEHRLGLVAAVRADEPSRALLASVPVERRIVLPATAQGRWSPDDPDARIESPERPGFPGPDPTQGEP